MTVPRAPEHVVRRLRLHPSLVAQLGLCLLLAILIWPLAAHAMDDDSLKLQEAVHLMETRGDYATAILIFEKLIEGKDRELAASSLLYIGLCYEKLDQPKAEVAYERLIEEFADQRRVVAETRNRLTALRRATMFQADAPLARKVWEGTAYAASPNGRLLATTDWNTGNLATVDVATGTFRTVTVEGDWANGQTGEDSAISPDGRYVAHGWWDWTRGDIGELRLSEIDGTQSRVLYRDDRIEYIEPHAWTPDGQHVVVFATDSNGVGSIALVSTDGEFRSLRNLGQDRPNKVSISPDGRLLTYDAPSRSDPTHRDIFALAMASGDVEPLISDPNNDLYPLWTPTGDRLLFLSDRSGLMGLWTIGVENGDTVCAPVMVKPDMEQTIPLGVARDGSLFYTVRLGGANVYVTEIDTDSGALLAPSRQISLLNVGSNLQPDWSPDGTKLAFVTRQGWLRLESSTDRLTILDVENGDIRVLEPDLGVFRSPTWTGDGRAVRVAGWDLEGSPGLYEIDVETAQVTTLWRMSEFVGVQWAPDGTRVYFERDNLMVRDIVTGAEAELYDGGVGGLRISRDGTRLAFRYDEDDVRGIMVLSVDGLHRNRLTRWQGQEWLGQLWDWTPDGAGVIWESAPDSPDGAKMWYVPVNGSPRRELAVDPADGQNFRFHPDGRRLAFTGGEQRHEVWVIQNFLADRVPRP